MKGIEATIYYYSVDAAIQFAIFQSRCTNYRELIKSNQSEDIQLIIIIPVLFPSMLLLLLLVLIACRGVAISLNFPSKCTSPITI